MALRSALDITFLGTSTCSWCDVTLTKAIENFVSTCGGPQADAQLDEVLTTLAHQFRGVVFLRTPLSGFKAPVVTQLGIPCESGEGLIVQSHRVWSVRKWPVLTPAADLFIGMWLIALPTPNIFL